MAKSVNRVHLLGNVGATPEYKVFRDGNAAASLSLATNERRQVNGEWKDVPEWHSLTVTGKLADVVHQYVLKGSKIYVEGRLRTRNWDDKETGKKVYKTEIVMLVLVLLGGPADGRYEADEHSQADPVEVYAGAY